jgi:predicted naringenin-chalcone synthase
LSTDLISLSENCPNYCYKESLQQAQVVKACSMEEREHLVTELNLLIAQASTHSRETSRYIQYADELLGEMS